MQRNKKHQKKKRQSGYTLDLEDYESHYEEDFFGMYFDLKSSIRLSPPIVVQ